MLVSSHLLNEGEKGACGYALRQVGVEVLPHQESGTLALVHALHRPGVRVVQPRQCAAHAQKPLTIGAQLGSVTALGINLWRWRVWKASQLGSAQCLGGRRHNSSVTQVLAPWASAVVAIQRRVFKLREQPALLVLTPSQQQRMMDCNAP